jgi:hypothetical protein
VILALYGDDSSDQQQKEVLTAGAVLGWPGDIFEAERKWEPRLQRDKLPYFRSVECENFRGAFDLRRLGGLNQGRAIVDSLVYDLRVILKKNAVGCVAVSLLLDDFHKLIASSKKARAYYGTDPTIAVYKTLIKTTIELLNRDWLQSRGIPISFIFDEHGGYLAAEAAYNELRKIPLYGKRMAVVSHGNDKMLPPLQMADLMAYEARYETLHWLGRQPQRPMFKALAAAHSIYSITVMNKKGMQHELRTC